MFSNPPCEVFNLISLILLLATTLPAQPVPHATGIARYSTLDSDAEARSLSELQKTQRGGSELGRGSVGWSSGDTG